MTSSFFTTEDGCVLGYEDVGAGMPVVWQHGLGGDRAQPAEVFPENISVRRITLECRGHAKSQLGDPDLLSIAQFALDVLALLDHLEIEKAVFGGISLGAAISMRLASMVPSRTVGLILARPAWTDYAAPSTMKPYILVAELLQRFGRHEGLQQFSRSLLYSKIKEISPDNAESLCSFFSRSDQENIIELLLRLPRDGPGLSSGEIASIAVPTLIIGTEEEYVHPVIYAFAIKNLIPSSVVRVITSKTIDKRLYRSEFREAIAAFLGDRVAAR